MRLLLAVLAVLALFAAPASARPGDIDRSFGREGRAPVHGDRIPGLVRTAADGRVVYTASGRGLYSLDRRGRAVDGFRFEHSGDYLATRGGVVAVESRRGEDGLYRFFVVRFDLHGRRVSGPTRLTGLPPVNLGLSGLMEGHAGELIVVLMSETLDWTKTSVIQRISATGEAVGPPVTLSGMWIGGPVSALRGRGFIDVISRPEHLLAIDRLGRLIAGFDAPAVAGRAEAIAPTPDGGAWVSSHRPGGLPGGTVRRLDRTGAVRRVLRFGTTPTELATDGAGRLVVGLQHGHGVIGARVIVRRFSAAGQPDRAFGRDGAAYLGPRRGFTGTHLSSLIAAPSGRVIVGIVDSGESRDSRTQVRGSIISLRG